MLQHARDPALDAGAVRRIGRTELGLEADLVNAPWAADFETLDARQQAVMACLAATEVFGQYASSSKCSAGARWAAIPITTPP